MYKISHILCILFVYCSNICILYESIKITNCFIRKIYIFKFEIPNRARYNIIDFDERILKSHLIILLFHRSLGQLVNTLCEFYLKSILDCCMVYFFYIVL